MRGLGARWRPLLAATLGIGIGLFAISRTAPTSELGRVFPAVAALIAIAAGAALALRTMLRPGPPPVAGSVEHRRAALMAVTLLVWAITLKTFGFVATSAIALVAISAITRREPMSIRSILFHAVAGVALVWGFALVLSEVLNVRLP